MKYQVVITAEAQLEISDATIWWAENRSLEQAARWHRGIHTALDRLSENPQQHGFARENGRFPNTLRQLLFGLGRKATHRAIFQIEDQTVNIISVRHVAQRDLSPAERQ